MASVPNLPPCSGLQPKHRRLAEITEMIHTASLIHDDVLDESSRRRGILAAQWPPWVRLVSRLHCRELMVAATTETWCISAKAAALC